MSSGKKFWETEPTLFDDINNVGLRLEYFNFSQRTVTLTTKNLCRCLAIITIVLFMQHA